MEDGRDNRALTLLFRVFGGYEPPSDGDAREISPTRGMHEGEFRAFSVLVPVTVWVILADRLALLSGNVTSWLVALPLAFLSLNLLPFVLRTSNASLQWKLWLGGCIAWAVWRREASGVVGVIAYAWIGIAVLYFAAALVTDWHRTMSWPGRAGIMWRVFLAFALHAGALAAGWKWGWPTGLVCAGAIGGLWCLAVLRPGCQWLGPVYRTTDGAEPLITIDDGPDPRDTPVLLDLLDRHETKAVFFMIGEKAKAHPDLVREVVRRGHGIGNHTLTHPQAGFWCAGPWRTWREIAECQGVIREITGENPKWFRAPVGHRNYFTHPVCRVFGLRVMGWNRRGYDAVEKDANKVLGRILPEMGKGDIVLLHEGTPIAAEVLEGVLAALERVPGKRDPA